MYSYSVKIHKPLNLQSNIEISTIKKTSILQDNTIPNKKSVLNASVIRSIKKNNNISKVISEISYQLILIFLSNETSLCDYDDLCINLTSYNQIVVACKFNNFNNNNDVISKKLNELLSHIIYDFLITTHLRLLFNGIIIIGHLQSCDMINNLIKNKILNTDNFKIIFLDPFFQRDNVVFSNNVSIIFSKDLFQNNKMYTIDNIDINIHDIVSVAIMNVIQMLAG